MVLGGMPTILYYLGLSTLFTHELDAVMQAEWRLLFFLREMSDQSAYPIFLVLHIPAFFLFFWLSHHSNQGIKLGFRRIVASFLIIHACIHFYLADAPDNHFQGLLSNTLIYAAAVFGLLYVFFSVRESLQNAA